MNNGVGGDASGITWNNTSGSIRWNHLFNERLFSNTTFFKGKYDYSLVTSAANKDAWNSRISNTGLKTDFTFYPTPGTTLTFGGKVGIHSINPGNFTYGDGARNGSVPVVPLRNAIEWNTYLGIIQRLGEKWSLYAGLRSTLWQNSGAAFTTPSSFYEYQGHTIPVYTEKNNDRLPAYYRLDLEVAFKLNKPGKNFKHELSVSLFNAYGRKNPVFINFNKIENSNGNLLVPVNLLLLPELVPGQIWLYKTVPSLNYKFRF